MTAHATKRQRNTRRCELVPKRDHSIRGAWIVKPLLDPVAGLMVGAGLSGWLRDWSAPTPGVVAVLAFAAAVGMGAWTTVLLVALGLPGRIMPGFARGFPIAPARALAWIAALSGLIASFTLLVCVTLWPLPWVGAVTIGCVVVLGLLRCSLLGVAVGRARWPRRGGRLR